MLPPSETDAFPSPPRLSAFALAIILAAGTMLAFIVFGSLSQALSIPFGIAFTEIFLFLGIPFVALQMTGRDPWIASGVRPAPPMNALWLGALLGIANLLAIGLPLQLLSHALAPKALRDALDATRVFKEQLPLELGLTLVGVGVLAPICEEYFFRGVFLRGLRERFPEGPRALVFSALWFSFMHLEPLGFLARAELGLLFGWLYLRTGSIWPGVLAHAANNLTSTAMYFLPGQGEAPPPASDGLGWDEVRAGADPRADRLRAADRALPLRPDRTCRRERTVEDPVRPRRSLWSAAAFWFAGAALSVALLFAVDARGVELNAIDFQYPLPKSELDTRTQARQQLSELRKQVRRKQAKVEDYEALRKALSKGGPLPAADARAGSAEAVGRDLQDRPDHREREPVVLDVALDLDPRAVLLQAAVAARELVGLPVVALEHPDPGLDVAEDHPPRELHRAASRSSIARATKRQTNAFTTSQGIARNWNGSQASPGACANAA